MAHQLTSVDPRNGRPLPPVDCTPVNDIPGMIDRARAAQPHWADLGFAERRRRLEAFAKDLADHADALGELASSEMGKPVDQAVAEARGYVDATGRMLDLMGEAVTPETMPFDGGATVMHWLPLGVAAAITPWNFPVGMPLSLLIPALSGGNTVVYKPSEITPRTGLKVAELLNRHLPDDVLIPVTGDGEQGRALVEGDIDLITFVGSRDVGKGLLKAASRRAARVLLEMGGKDAMVVAADADLEAAARFAVTNALRNSGQVCCSVERIYVEKSAHDAFADKVREAMAAVTVDEPSSSGLSIGPMSSERQKQLVLDQLQDARDKGARVEGGESLDRPGWYLNPALVTGVTDDMRMQHDETFGPVVSIEAVADLESGIAKANDSRFGLTATLWIGDDARGRELAPRLEAGLVGVNRGFYGAPGTPWAGAKESGYGHTGGISGMRNFLQVRSVAAAQESRKA